MSFISLTFHESVELTFSGLVFCIPQLSKPPIALSQ